jgi:hypothetical protein
LRDDLASTGLKLLLPLVVGLDFEKRSDEITLKHLLAVGICDDLATIDIDSSEDLQILIELHLDVAGVAAIFLCLFACIYWLAGCQLLSERP